MTHALIAAAALLALAAPAAAEAPKAAPQEITICLDVGGHSQPAVCHASGGRLDARDIICLCPEGRRITAPVCGEGENAPAETAAFDRARKDAAADGSLIGDLYEGRPMCVTRDYLPSAP